MTLWGGRFAEKAAAELSAFKDSIAFDQRLYAEDIAGSVVYARALARAGVLSDDEATRIIAGLEEVRREFAAGCFEFRDSDEDIHTAVERRLIEMVGAVGGKLHTGRSRNEQVATDLRLWLLARLADLEGDLNRLQAALVGRASEHLDSVMPGYTHFQPAQPISAAHWLLSFFWMLRRDRLRIRDLRRRTAFCPLGSGALAGTPFPLDREAMARELGFRAPTENSLDAVSDRDFVAETLFAAALLGTHLSRLAEDVILFTNPALGFLRLPDRFSTGSSLMPQKRNADVFELTRGKAGRLLGNLIAVLTMLKGLPSGYNADLQEDKEALFDTLDTLSQLLPLLVEVMSSLEFDTEAMRAAVDQEMLATDLADYLVAKGVPFREAHDIVGRAVARAAAAKIPIAELPLSDLRGLSKHFGEDVTEVYNMDAALARRGLLGGTSPKAVAGQLVAARVALGELGSDGGNG